jgi:hypothetical protein
MAKPEEKHQPVDWGAAAAVLDDFLTWTQENRAAKTYARYRDFIQSFVHKFGRIGVAELNPGHVTTWLNTQTGWNSTTKRNAITALQRGFNWAVKNRGMERNPIRGMEKASCQFIAAVAMQRIGSVGHVIGFDSDNLPALGQPDLATAVFQQGENAEKGQ